LSKKGAIKFFSTDENLMNKSDSPHTLGNPRLLGSDPHNLRYIAERLEHIARTECDDADVLMGLASFGLGLAAVVSLVSLEGPRPIKWNYVKLVAEKHKGKQQIEGDWDPRERAILIDDLIFHGTTSKGALQILFDHGYGHIVRDLIYIIDRQLERRHDEHGKGNTSLAAHGHRIHSMITMEDIIDYMVENGAITPAQLEDVIHDYDLYPRHRTPRFLRAIQEARTPKPAGLDV
jgi:orotate phosphoribosyltransferase